MSAATIDRRQAPLPHTVERFRVGDLALAYRRVGAAGRRPVVILHGLSYFSYDWLPIASALGADREVVALDLRGFGDSDRSPGREYSLRAFARDVDALLSHLGWSDVLLAGHSMGGRIALCTAAWHPARVGRLACLDFAPDVAAAGRRKVAERIGRQPDVFASIDDALVYHGLDPASADPAIRARYEAFLSRTAAGFVLKRDLHFRDQFRAVLETGKSPPPEADFWAMVSALAIPALFVRGRESDMFAAETMDKLSAANPAVQVVEIAGTHDVAGDNPDGVVECLRAFADAGDDGMRP